MPQSASPLLGTMAQLNWVLIVLIVSVEAAGVVAEGTLFTEGRLNSLATREQVHYLTAIFDYHSGACGYLLVSVPSPLRS